MQSLAKLVHSMQIVNDHIQSRHLYLQSWLSYNLFSLLAIESTLFSAALSRNNNDNECLFDLI